VKKKTNFPMSQFPLITILLAGNVMSYQGESVTRLQMDIKRKKRDI
jgi:hypothetical protein